MKTAKQLLKPYERIVKFSDGTKIRFPRSLSPKDFDRLEKSIDDALLEAKQGEK